MIVEIDSAISQLSQLGIIILNNNDHHTIEKLYCAIAYFII